jgi:hypothetical protein
MSLKLALSLIVSIGRKLISLSFLHVQEQVPLHTEGLSSMVFISMIIKQAIPVNGFQNCSVVMRDPYFRTNCDFYY